MPARGLKIVESSQVKSSQTSVKHSTFTQKRLAAYGCAALGILTKIDLFVHCVRGKTCKHEAARARAHASNQGAGSWSDQNGRPPIKRQFQRHQQTSIGFCGADDSVEPALLSAISLQHNSACWLWLFGTPLGDPATKSRAQCGYAYLWLCCASPHHNQAAIIGSSGRADGQCPPRLPCELRAGAAAGSKLQRTVRVRQRCLKYRPK